MTVLSETEIIRLIRTKQLVFTPELDRFQIRPHSVDLRLGFTMMVPKAWHMTVRGREAIPLVMYSEKSQNNMDVVELEEGQFFEILPGEFILASTLEKIKMPKKYTAVLYPRSSLVRKGLAMSATGFVHAGWEGVLIFSLQNMTSQSVRVYPGERFCHMLFQEVISEPKSMAKDFYNMDVAKWDSSSANKRERNLVKKGKINELKKKYPIK